LAKVRKCITKHVISVDIQWRSWSKQHLNTQQGDIWLRN
jgi:hypothetical protein